MSQECRPVPCPEFETTELHVDGTCHCADYPPLGDPHCVVHGHYVTGYIDGWNGAIARFRHTFQILNESEIGA